MNILDTNNIKEFISRTSLETEEIAYTFSRQLKRNDVIALHGELGSGKTCFVQGLARALGITRPVTSPTFIIINRYKGNDMFLFHVDLYRINSNKDIILTDLEECFEAGGITAIEWAEKAENMLPKKTIHIYFEFLSEENTRKIKIYTPS